MPDPFPIPMATQEMPAAVSGLVITAVDDQPMRAELVAALRQVGCFEVGDWMQNRLPVALEAEDERASRNWIEWLCGMPGVVKVDLAFVAWDE